MTGEDAAVVRTEVDGYEADLRDLLRDYFEFADERATDHFEELSGIDAGDAADADIDRLVSAKVDEPLFLALVGSGEVETEAVEENAEIVGTVQLKRLDQTTAEVKRLYVVPARRGEGLGRRLMEAVLDGATEEGFSTLRLGVGPYLETAQSLYEDLGFEYTSRYDRSNAPEAVTDEWNFMRYSLAGD